MVAYVSPQVSMLIEAVKKASVSIDRDFNEIEQLQSSVKGYKQFVLGSYDKVKRILQSELGKIHPDYPIVETAVKLPATGGCWLVNPIDGLFNFAHGIPHFAVSVALYENGKIIGAVVYNPASDALYFAEKGKGAFKEGYRNHERLRVSARKDLKDALIGTLVSYDKGVAEYEKIQKAIVGACDNIRISGSCALDLAYVAAGKLDAHVSLKNNLADYAAGLLLVKEAGGYVYDVHQKDIRSENLDVVVHSGNLIATNAELGKKVCELFK
ncbi:MAG: inositol monophosphatase [Alphaproteobacteria bacterium]|nr:inositol monophosphatase [Alphaproteobacteria bacterium]